MLEKVYFVVPEIPVEISRLLTSHQPWPDPEFLAPDRPPLRGAQWSWIFQTFLYMKRAGLDVELVDRPVDNAICVVHYNTTKNKIWPATSFVVGVRADNAPMRMREIEIVQSPANLSGQNTYLVNHWPQPQLIARDKTRGCRVERISYFGGRGGVSPAFSSAAFREALRRMGVSLDLCYDTTQWNDYRNTDIILAVRNHHHSWLIDTKPTSKLVNAWKAGCVALLGKEPAFCAIGNDGEDYFQVRTPEDVLALVSKLQQNPQRYGQVRSAGMKRYSEFSFEAIQQRWVSLFTGPISTAFSEWQQANGIRAGLRYPRRYWQACRQWQEHKLFMLPIRVQEFISERCLPEITTIMWQNSLYQHR